MGFTACQKEIQEEVPADKGTVVISFVADAPDTKTSVNTDGDAPVFTWDENEEFVVLEQTDKLAVASSVTYEKNDEGKAMIKATFDANSDYSTYDYVTVYPAGGYVNAESIAAATLSLPAVQTMAEGSYDPDADLMVSRVVTADAQPTEAQMVGFTRLAAVVKMTLKNFEPEDGDEVEQVIFTAAGKNLAGTVNADLNDPHAFTVADGNGVDNVTVNTTSASDVYFTVLPTTLVEGDAYTVTVITNEKLYVKTGTIGEDKTLSFEAGMVTRFGVNMEGVAPSEKWVLVRDASTLEENDIVTIAASDFNYVMGKMGSQYAYASFTEVIKMDDYLYHPVTPAGTTSGDNVLQQLTLAKSDKENAFHFYNGLDFSGDSYSGYVCTYSTNNYLKVQNYPNNKSLFYITIDSESGVASLVASDSDDTYKILKYRAYSGGKTTGNRRFGCTNAATSEHHDVCIYKLLGAKGVVPTAGAVVTVPDAEEPVVIAKDGVAEETVFEGVKFTYVGDWNISVSDNAEWLTVNYADGALSYTAEANDGTVRYATVTITASLEGEESKTWTFPVVQKGAPIKATVAEFLAVAIEENINPNIEYEVTGILLSKPSSSASGTVTIKDINGNEALFKYVYMTDGTTSLYSNNNINVDDVVTIVAAVSDEKTGGSSTAHAICKGYYNFSASAEEDLVGYEGGSVKLTLTKGGTLAPAGDISCSVNGSGAEVAYTTNAMEATLTFEANDDAPRQAVVTFTDGYASASVAVVQGADTAKGNTWELVTDASTLEAGDQVIIAAKDYDVAMSTTISSERRSAVAVTKLGNYYLTPAAGAQTLVLANGSAEGTFAFYDATNEGFLVSTSTSYKLNNQTYIDANTSFTVSIADGVATIGNKEGSYSSNKIYYREGSSYNYFYSGTTAKQAVCLYRLVGVKGEIPVTPADITIPSKSVVVAEEGAAVATPINDVVFNYVGDWNISATSEADWITFAFDKANNQLTYTALANEGTVRETTATITASMEGQESKTWTFKVLQKGKPMEITCDALNDKEQNLNVSYKLTGRIVSIPSSASGDFVLDDGSGRQAKISYLYTEDNSKAMYNNTDVGLAVGDVVTVTTIVYTKGKGGNTNYHSTYKGHYRLTATADVALISNEGGTVNFDIATSGNVPAGAIVEGSVAEDYDFVTFNYTSGSSAATATFAANNGAGRNATFNFTFGLASVSVTIGQLNDPSVKKGWFLVTEASELAIGDKVIIAAKNVAGNLNYAIKTYPYSSNKSYGIAIELLGNSISSVDGVEHFTLGSGHVDYAGTWSFKCDSFDRYLYVTSGDIKLTSTLNNAGSWTIEIASDGKATLISKVGTSASTKTHMGFNDAPASLAFSAYKAADVSSKGAIYLYKYYE